MLLLLLLLLPLLQKSTIDVEINCETEFEKNKIYAEACVMSTFDRLQLSFKWLRNQ